MIGRVALEPGHPDADLIGESFYIAGWRPGDPDEIGFEVVNWAAPIAALFFAHCLRGMSVADALAKAGSSIFGVLRATAERGEAGLRHCGG